jgi:hypothetical protein
VLAALRIVKHQTDISRNKLHKVSLGVTQAHPTVYSAHTIPCQDDGLNVAFRFAPLKVPILTVIIAGFIAVISYFCRHIQETGLTFAEMLRNRLSCPRNVAVDEVG